MPALLQDEDSKVSSNLFYFQFPCRICQLIRYIGGPGHNVDIVFFFSTVFIYYLHKSRTIPETLFQNIFFRSSLTRFFRESEKNSQYFHLNKNVYEELDITTLTLPLVSFLTLSFIMSVLPWPRTPSPLPGAQPIFSNIF